MESLEMTGSKPVAMLENGLLQIFEKGYLATSVTYKNRTSLSRRWNCCKLIQFPTFMRRFIGRITSKMGIVFFIYLLLFADKFLEKAVEKGMIFEEADVLVLLVKALDNVKRRFKISS